MPACRVNRNGGCISSGGRRSSIAGNNNHGFSATCGLVFQVGTGAAQDRLEKLIALRLQDGADKDEIDARI